jgi:hypothetical protein
VHARLPTPLPESLPNKIKDNTKRAPQEDQAHIEHDGRYNACLDRPRRNELRKAVAPEILINGDGDEDGARDGLIAVNCVGGGDGGDAGDLDAGAGEANDYDDLEWLVLVGG